MSYIRKKMRSPTMQTIETTSTTPLITPSRFFTDPNYLGKVQLFPKQREIVLTFLEGGYQVGVWCLGRRSGKTFLTALIASFLAIAYAPIFRGYVLDGESFYLLFVANSQEQAQLILRQVKLFFNSSPILKQAIAPDYKDKQTALHLTNGAVFKVLPNNPESVRGYPAAFVSLDEAAFYGSGQEKKLTGEALQSALEPAIAQFGPASKLLLTSTPWTKKGIFYINYEKGLSGKYPEIQSINHPTWAVNPTISKAFLTRAKRRDPLMFEVEYGASFAIDFAAFLDVDKVRSCITLPAPSTGAQRPHRYFLALDPALSGDAFTAGVGHVENNKLHIDLLYEFLPSFDRGGNTKQVVDISKVEAWILQKNLVYKFQKIVLDQYQSQSTIQRLQRQLGQSKVQEFTWTQKSKTEAYSYLKELVNTEKICFYPHEQAIAQLINLQVYYSSNGKWTVSGGKGLRVDDYCSVIAALAHISKQAPRANWAAHSHS